jgi:hypothetical protein
MDALGGFSMSTKRTYVEGREDQYREMLQQLANFSAKYKGVRGELLAKVRAELEQLKPNASGLAFIPGSAPATVPAAAAPAVAAQPIAHAGVNPSCRVCGREMRLNGTDGRFVCQNGHVR